MKVTRENFNEVLLPGHIRRMDIRYYGNRIEVFQPCHIVGFVRKTISYVRQDQSFANTDVAILLPQGEVAIVPAPCIKEVLR